MMVSKFPPLLDSGFASGSSLRIFTSKDLPLVLDADRELGVTMLTAAARALQDRRTGALGGSPELQEPHRYAKGIEMVILNGRVAVERGEHTGTLAGRVLRHG